MSETTEAQAPEKILCEQIFKLPIDDLDMLLEAHKENFKSAKSQPLTDVLEDLNLQLLTAVGELSSNVIKLSLQGVEKDNVRTARYAYDMMSSKNRMMLRENLSWDKIFVHAQAAFMCTAVLTGGIGRPGSMMAIDGKNLPPELKKMLGKIIEDVLGSEDKPNGNGTDI